MKKNLISLICLTCSSFLSGNVAALELCGELKQGEIVVLKEQSEMSLHAFDRDANLKQSLKNKPFVIAKGDWDIQRLTGVQQNKVTPSKQDNIAIEFERNAIQKAYEKEVNTSDWQVGFIKPVEGRISGKFGGQRIMNGTPLNYHGGLDIAALQGTPVMASSKGEVVLAEPNLFYSGNVVIISHGGGLKTIYAHLKDIKVSVGDLVEKGQLVGTVGKTGRVTGAHLHWGANLNGTRFNPLSLITVEKNQKNCLIL